VNPQPPIYYPGNGDTVPQRFVAYGSVPATVTAVTASLKLPTGAVVATGRTLRNPPHWVIFFDTVPVGTYTLELVDSATSTALGRSNPMSVIEVIHTAALSVSYPPSGSRVCQNFSAYGTTNQPNPVSGQLTGPNTVNGTTLQGTPNWVVQFNNVPLSASTYTLTVTAGSSSSSATNLTMIGCTT
jgi:hypothetical protein